MHNDGKATTGNAPEGYQLAMSYDAQNRMKTASYMDGTGSHLLQYAFGRNNLLAEMKKSENSILTSTITYLNDGANRS
jgi:hypothetical protein